MNLDNSRALVRLSKKGWARLTGGHLWVFREDLEVEGSPENGQIINVVSHSGKPCGWAFYSSNSKIAIRMISGPGKIPNKEFWYRRFENAQNRRSQLLKDRQTLRLVFTEGDLMPGLVVDKYGPGLVIQSFHPSVDRFAILFADFLSDQYDPSWILLRNDSRPRELESIPIETKVLRGKVPETFEIKEGIFRYLVDPWRGHKTGLYLDQWENHRLVVKYARGRVLDGFCYQGHFSIACSGNAKEVIAIDSSADALKIFERNLELNSINNVQTLKGNVFDYLKKQASESNNDQFDLIILDPPPFAKRQKSSKGALRGYLELCNRALRLLTPGGVLIIFSCSYHFGADDLKRAVSIASSKCARPSWIVEEFRQPLDHPILVGVPETSYLKGLAVQVE